MRRYFEGGRARQTPPYDCSFSAVPRTVLRSHRSGQRPLTQPLALWDVYAACRREGSLDSAIEDAEPNDLAVLVAGLPSLRAIAHNGGESARAMRITRAFGLPVHRLPSTSPANASWSFECKLASWHEVFATAGLVASDTGTQQSSH